MSGPDLSVLQLSPCQNEHAAGGVGKPACFQPSDDSDLSAESSQEAALMRECDVAIIGGGLGGLALAVGLTSRGYDVQIFEAAPQLRTGTSTMIGLGESVISLLGALHPGLAPQVKARGANFTTVVMRTKASKEEELVEMKVPMHGRYTIRWSQMQEALADLVPPEAVHCGYRATGYTEDGSDRVKVHFKDREDVHARLVIAADGIRSPLRATMLPNDPGPRYLGQMCWNMILHNPDNSVVAAHEPEMTVLYMNYAASDKRTLSCITSDAGCGYTYFAFAARSETPSFTPDPSQLEPEAAQQAPGAMQPQPYIVGGGKGRPGSKARPEELLKAAGWDEPLAWVQACPESEIFERALLDRVPLDELGGRMSSPGGRVLLLGDAAHAVHPAPGQGGCTAMEDAHALVQLLEKHRTELSNWSFASTDGSVTKPPVGDKAALEEVVSGYEAARLVRVCRVQRYSAESSGLASVRDASRPPDAPTSGPLKMQRDTEFIRWMNQYPDNPTGDPDSTFWKPPSAVV